MRTNIDQLRIVNIDKIIDETHTVRTLVFRDELSSNASAGQFLMVWIPGAEELPMSIMLRFEKDFAAVTVRRKGFGSTSLFEKKIGDKLGIRGPYGNSFEIAANTKKVLLVGGGTGLVPLLRLTDRLNRAYIDTTLIIGAKTCSEVFFEELASCCLGNTSHRVVVTTEDGSYGRKGNATDAMRVLISLEKFDAIYTCGPERMMKAVFDIALPYSIPLQASLERYMKCGIGICASCCIGDRLVCKDGPIFNTQDLLTLSEFGFEYRDKSGRICKYL